MSSPKASPRGSSRTLAVPAAHCSPVKESIVTDMEQDEDGTRRINQYSFVKFLGKGAYGAVWAGIDDNTKHEYAIKELSKSRMRKAQWALSSRQRMLAMRSGRAGPGARSPIAAPQPTDPAEDNEDLVHREIAILKRLCHPNCVKLHEVLEVPDGDEIYMVFEMCHGGPIMKLDGADGDQNPVPEAKARDYFQQMVLGFEYLHEHHIVHRDIKPDNLLLSRDGTLKIVDFGVSQLFKTSDQVQGNAGSPAFMAPEQCRMSSFMPSPGQKPFKSEPIPPPLEAPGSPPAGLENQPSKMTTNPETASPSSNAPQPPSAHIQSNASSSSGSSTSNGISGRAADVWSMGVTLYALLYGRLPFHGRSIVDLYRSICMDDPDYTPREGCPIPAPEAVNLLQRILTKDPNDRLDLDSIRVHPWVTAEGTEPLPPKAENVSCVVHPDDISREELASAISKIVPLWTVLKFVTNLKHSVSQTRLHSGNGDSTASGSRSASRSTSRVSSAIELDAVPEPLERMPEDMLAPLTPTARPTHSRSASLDTGAAGRKKPLAPSLFRKI